MKINVIAIEHKYPDGIESDIVSLSDSSDGLKIILEKLSESNEVKLIEVHFENCFGYRVLEEGDLVRYTNSLEFNNSNCVFEVKEGGWLSGELIDPGILSVSINTGVKEWFVATTGRSANVLSNTVPTIKNC